MDLTIDCAVIPTDTLAIYDTAGGHLCFEADDGGIVTMISVDRESATKLRDALTDWLGGEP